ncbi:hypothetical protein CANCADRAFT_4463, partial [Tortispora caseinolytica NRRL Y-17796]
SSLDCLVDPGYTTSVVYVAGYLGADHNAGDDYYENGLYREASLFDLEKTSYNVYSNGVDVTLEPTSGTTIAPLVEIMYYVKYNGDNTEFSISQIAETSSSSTGNMRAYVFIGDRAMECGDITKIGETGDMVKRDWQGGFWNGVYTLSASSRYIAIRYVIMTETAVNPWTLSITLTKGIGSYTFQGAHPAPVPAPAPGDD